jgi:hypothetical protein
MLEELLKVGVVLLLAPVWLPFMRALWNDLQDLFEEDGGLFGDDPGPRRREEIRAAKARRPPLMVHEWVAHHHPGEARNNAVPAARRTTAPSGRSSVGVSSVGGVRRASPDRAPSVGPRRFR